MTDPALFVSGKFQLASGQVSPWKIECDALGPEDWATIAMLGARLLPPFRQAFGVPRGGIPLADALNEHAREDGRYLLIVDDVWTTGGSLMRYHHETLLAERPGGSWFGFVAFSRGPLPSWVRSLFAVNPVLP